MKLPLHHPALTGLARCFDDVRTRELLGEFYAEKLIFMNWLKYEWRLRIRDFIEMPQEI